MKRLFGILGIAFAFVVGLFGFAPNPYALSDLGSVFNNLTGSGITEATELAAGAGGGMIIFYVGIGLLITVAGIILAIVAWKKKK